jgi:isochorismate synthase EntC
MVVAIRSASIEGNRATVYSGVGLVAGSQAADEYEETAWKMRRMLDALGVQVTEEADFSASEDDMGDHDGSA